MVLIDGTKIIKYNNNNNERYKHNNINNMMVIVVLLKYFDHFCYLLGWYATQFE